MKLVDPQLPFSTKSNSISNVYIYLSVFQQSYEYDIAVLRMVRPVDFQPNAIPICLPRNNDELVGRIGSVTGKVNVFQEHYFQKEIS